ncbi:MAG: hypothetical protein R8K53_02250 [Mariprofundaceae bacterium]
MRIGVIGSGPAAVGALQAIARIRPDAKVVLFDIGKEVSESNFESDGIDSIRQFHTANYKRLKKHFGYRFPPLKTLFSEALPQYSVAGSKRFFRSELCGGLSNFWGGTMLPFDGDDFSGWPINGSDLEHHYHDIANLVGVSGASDELSRCYEKEYINRPPIRVLQGLKRLCDSVNSEIAEGVYDVRAGVNRVALETRDDHDKACVYCGECMAGCVVGAVYSARNSIHRFISDMNIDYRPEKVLAVSADAALVKIRTNGGEADESFDKVFLCAGCLGTTEIIMRSLGVTEGPKLIDNSILQFPIINYSSSRSDTCKDRYFSLSNLIFACQPKNGKRFPAQVQIYPNFDYLWRNSMPEALWPLASKFVSASRDRLLWARVYLHGELSHHYSVSLNHERGLSFEEIQSPNLQDADEVLQSIKSVINRNGFYVPPVKPSFSKTSSHLAGTLPYGGSIIPLNADGEVMSNTYVCDSACFPSSPAGSPTFTIMANASRTVSEALS